MISLLRLVVGSGPIVRDWRQLTQDLKGCLLIYLVFAFTVIALFGCASKPVSHSRPIAGAGVSAARADVGLGFVGTMIDKAYQSCSETGQALLDAARAAANSALTDLAAVNAQLDAANAERDQLIQGIEKERDRANRAEANPGYVVYEFIARWVRRLYLITLSGIGLALVLRLAGFFLGGATGQHLANGGNFILHLATAGVTWMGKKILSWRSAAKAVQQ